MIPKLMTVMLTMEINMREMRMVVAGTILTNMIMMFEVVVMMMMLLLLS